MSNSTRLAYTSGFFLAWAGVYFFIQLFIQTSDISFLTSYDEKIPLVPQFIWVYHSLIPGIFITMIYYVREKNLFFRVFWACIVASVVMNIFYVFLPSFYPRGDLVITGTADYVLHMTRIIDGANNTFPSSHVTFSWLMFLAILHTKSIVRAFIVKSLFFIWAFGITAATLFLKQHYIADVIFGVLLSFMAFYAAKQITTYRSKLFINKTT